MERIEAVEASATAREARARVAVIAVHGIADQRRGETGEAVALQLAGGVGAKVQRSELLLDVMPVNPVVTYKRWKPAGILQRVHKSLRQSWRSDFLDARIGADPKDKQDPELKRNSVQAQSDSHEQADAGVRYTDYLLSKAHAVRPERDDKAAEPPVETYSAAKFEVRDAKSNTDVYEMYWADLSRLAGGPMRIVTELFTLLFRLSRIGVDTVALEAALTRDRGMQRLFTWQRAADWLYSRVLALLALQLAVCALLIVPAALIPAHLTGLSVVLVVLAGVAVAAGLVYYRRWPWWKGFWAGAAVMAVGGALFRWLLRPEHASVAVDGLMLVWIGLLCCLYWRLMSFCEERFKAIFGVGLVLFALTLASVVAGRVGLWWDGADGKTWIDGALAALEAALLLHALLWGVMGVLLAVAVVLGWAASRGNDAAAPARRQAVTTARLGLFTSVGVFLAFLMVGWGITSAGVERVVTGNTYEAWWFKPLSPVPCSDQRRWWFEFLPAVNGGCFEGREQPTAFASVRQVVDAQDFLAERHAQSSASFSAVSLLLLCLLGFIALIFLPSVLIEARRGARPASERLGLWLTAGYRSLERFVRWWGAAVVIVAVVTAALLVLSQLARSEGGQPGGYRLIEWLADLSRDWVSLIVKAIAGGAVGLIALGTLAAKQLQRLRAPLDSALDVDNHFREFPRRAIPRVRIIERYVALLDHVLRGGYERVVIVAHSQGTVITAELLRYLQQRERLVIGEHRERSERGQVNLADLKRRIETTEVALLTVGCPLRQLYALRFPSLYQWVLFDPLGPVPSQLGVRTWVNLWASGDYVGRWLWSSDMRTTPLALSIDEARYGGGVEEGHDAGGAAWKDRCLGADAHTHYFDIEQEVVKAELEGLVR